MSTNQDAIRNIVNGISAAFAQPNGSIAISNLAADARGNQTTLLGFSANMLALTDAGMTLIKKYAQKYGVGVIYQ